jgi:hypothetical protein
VVGDPRGKLYQRMAEQSRLQLRLEQRISQNDARMAQLLTALTARAAAAAPRPSPPQPQPAPVPTVAPIQPVVRAPQPLQAAPPPTDFDAPPPRLRTVAAVEPPASPAPPLSPPISG